MCDELWVFDIGDYDATDTFRAAVCVEDIFCITALALAIREEGVSVIPFSSTSCR
jgi:hypothetical protein